ncbi:hypothetical protein [Tychonema sp. LEGE 07203]|uniref:hypothetical protein n=1 Tax=Tychonema sp. LEGE 07203 TaxID=1828671 RepID=UPI001880AC90|nr:hypothetical protein [Tychonema sp. LEGE 07203]MBE9096044.1 hypothetical protein [Tychonema sp. LEGE 07203]
MTIGESSDNNAVEVDGIRFETILSDRLWAVPIKRTTQDDHTSVVLGFSITNNTSTPYYFCFFQFVPEIITSDAQNINPGYQADGVGVPHESDLHLTMPGKSVTFSQAAQCYWERKYPKIKRKQDRDLMLFMPFTNREYWKFHLPSTGNYSIRFKYEVTNGAVKGYDELIDKECLKMVWVGQVFTPFIEFCIVEPVTTK